MSMIDEENNPVVSVLPQSAAEAIDELKARGGLDALFAKIDAGQLQLTGAGGFVPGLVKAAMERGLQAELSEHLGYEKGDPDARFYSNSRNGTTPKTVSAEIGDLALDIPRDRAGSFVPHLVPKGSRRLGGLDDMIISLYAGGMTIREIQHHLAATIRTELGHETISKITDEVLQEVLAWQVRQLEARQFLPVVGNRVFQPSSHELCRCAITQHQPGAVVKFVSGFR